MSRWQVNASDGVMEADDRDIYIQTTSAGPSMDGQECGETSGAMERGNKAIPNQISVFVETHR